MIKRDNVRSVAVLGAGALATTLYLAQVARIASIEVLGKFILLTTFARLVAPVLRCGLVGLVLASGAENGAEIRGAVYRLVLRINVAFVALALACAAGLALCGASWSWLVGVALVLASAGPQNLATCASSVAATEGRGGFAGALLSLLAPTISLLATMAYPGQVSVNVASATFLLGWAATAALGHRYVVGLKLPGSDIRAAAMLSNSKPYLMTSLLLAAQENVPLVLLATYSSVNEMAVVSLVMRCAGLISQILSGIGNASAASIRAARTAPAELRSVHRESQRQFAYAGLPAAATGIPLTLVYLSFVGFDWTAVVLGVCLAFAGVFFAGLGGTSVAILNSLGDGRRVATANAFGALSAIVSTMPLSAVAAGGGGATAGVGGIAANWYSVWVLRRCGYQRSAVGTPSLKGKRPARRGVDPMA